MKAFFFIVSLLIVPFSVSATVTSLSAASETNLKAAVTNAADGDTIIIPSGIITLTSTVIINKNLILRGSGASLVALDGADNHRILDFSASNLIISNLQIQNGSSADGLGGAGLLVHSGSVTINNSTFTNNHDSTEGGAIKNNGTLTINRSTFFNNSSPQGAAISNVSPGRLNIFYNSFVSNNVSGTGAIDNSGTVTSVGTLYFNTIDCSGTGSNTSNGYNAFNANSATGSCSFVKTILAPDFFNLDISPVATSLSGAAETEILLPVSSQTGIIDKAPSTCIVNDVNKDQVGTIVPQNGRCDIGAVEHSSNAALTSATTATDTNCGESDDDHSTCEGSEGEENGVGSFDLNLLFAFILLPLLRKERFTKPIKQLLAQ